MLWATRIAIAIDLPCGIFPTDVTSDPVSRSSFPPTALTMHSTTSTSRICITPSFPRCCAPACSLAQLHRCCNRSSGGTLAAAARRRAFKIPQAARGVTFLASTPRRAPHNRPLQPPCAAWLRPRLRSPPAGGRAVGLNGMTKRYDR